MVQEKRLRNMSSLYDRIKQTVQNIRPPKLPYEVQEEELEWREEETGTPDVAMPKAGYLQEASAVAIIRKAAKHRLLVYMNYDGQWRQVEPYSFRHGKEGTLFFGHDLLRNNTRSYYVSKIEEVRMTDIPYNPRWYVEIE